MKVLTRATGPFAAILALTVLLPLPAAAQDNPLPPPTALQTEDETPWIYEGSDVPRDDEWLFGEMDNGLRYAVRRNGVPPGQMSIRIRIDAGSLHEQDSEQGYAHLLEHLVFRESKYLEPGETIPTWQRLGSTLGMDTNAETTPTHTNYKLDLPNIDDAKLAEAFRLLSGMVREPVLSDENVAAEVPIVLAERRERVGPGLRASEASRRTLFAGQRLAERSPIGTVATLEAARGRTVNAFHKRWYRPENAVIVAVGDADPVMLASLIEKWFGDWKGKGAATPAPDFGDPEAPAGADPENPVGEVVVTVEPDLPRSLSYGVMRPWRQVKDTVEYNEGRMREDIAIALINRRLEAHARAGGSYLVAQVGRDKISRSTDATLVSIVPLSEDWETALTDVRGVIADALADPASEEEIARELAEMEINFVSYLEQAEVEPASGLADTIVGAVDIRESVAAPDTFLKVFQSMKATATPQRLLGHTRALFDGNVIRAAYVTPAQGEASEDALRAALSADVAADTSARLAASTISFDDLPPIGEPGTIVSTRPTGVLAIEQIEFDNGVKALILPDQGEPGRVAVKVRFGGGYRSIEETDGAYARLAEMALVGSGVGELGQEELDRISTGRKMGFDFGIEEGGFTFFAQTRPQDLEDQLYLFAAKLDMPRWDAAPVTRAIAAARLSYESYGATAVGVLNRDLGTLLRDGDPRYATPDVEQLDRLTPEGFREAWEPILRQGPVEVLVFGDFDRAEGVEALAKTFGALNPREPLPADVAASIPGFPDDGETVTRFHRGDADQAAATIAWPSGGGVAGLRESRQLEILTQIFTNRLFDAMRERAGASYSPVVRSEWPSHIEGGGSITALAQLRPQDVPVFFREASRIAQDLATTPPSTDEITRVTEPLRQTIRRASSGNLFWLLQVEGATVDPRRLATVRTLLLDYSQTTPEAMQALAAKYFAGREGWRLAVLPQGQSLDASGTPPRTGPATGR